MKLKVEIQDLRRTIKEQESVIEALKSDLDETLAVLGEQPEIIRCKNCIHGCDWDDGRWKCIINGGMHAPDWFCADGERKD